MEIETTYGGGKQHKRECRMQAVMPRALVEVGNLRYKAKFEFGYDDDNYKGIDLEEHIGRAERHLCMYLINNDVDELTHAACRCLMALEEALEEEERNDRRAAVNCENKITSK